MRAAQRKSTSESRGGKGASEHHNPPLSGDHARDREIGSVSHKQARDSPLDSSDAAESCSAEQTSPKIKKRREIVASDTKSSHQKAHVISNAVSSDCRCTALRLAHERRYVIKMSLLVVLDR